MQDINCLPEVVCGRPAAVMPLACEYCKREFKSSLDRRAHKKSWKNGSCARVFGRRVAAKTAADSHPSQQSQAPPAVPEGQEELAESQQPEFDFNSFAQEEDYTESITPKFNTAFEIFRFLRLNNGEGTAAADQQQLLNLLHNPEFNLEEVRKVQTCAM
jgi:hypothetical protein